MEWNRCFKSGSHWFSKQLQIYDTVWLCRMQAKHWEYCSYPSVNNYDNSGMNLFQAVEISLWRKMFSKFPLVVWPICKGPGQFRQSDWTKRDHMGGVLTDGKDMAYPNQSSAYAPAVHQLFCAMCDAEWLFLVTCQAHVLESVLCVPKTWICPFLFDFIQINLNFFYILKTKWIQAWSLSPVTMPKTSH